GCGGDQCVALRSVRPPVDRAGSQNDCGSGKERFGGPIKRKEPPGNRAALSSGRIVPTEAKPSELSGCIVGAGGGSVKDEFGKKYVVIIQLFAQGRLGRTRGLISSC